MVMSPDNMRDAIIRNLKARTGKTLDQWIREARKTRLADNRELRRWLKSEFGLGGPTCMVIADATLRKPGDKAPTASKLLKTQFAGERKQLRPIYDSLVCEVKKLGEDVQIGVRKTQTTFSRGHTFAVAKAPTKTRIDLGLRLPGAKPTKRLARTTAFSDNASHCVALTRPEDVDTQLIQWLRAAYEARG